MLLIDCVPAIRRFNKYSEHVENQAIGKEKSIIMHHIRHHATRAGCNSQLITVFAKQKRCNGQLLRARPKAQRVLRGLVEKSKYERPGPAWPHDAFDQFISLQPQVRFTCGLLWWLATSLLP